MQYKTQMTSLTGSLVDRHLVGEDATDLAERWHLDAVLLQLQTHRADLLICR